jgi:transcriptional regulator with XRE-family HTH domain
MPAIRTPKDLLAPLKSRQFELGETQTESAARIRKTQSWVSDLERSTTPNIYIGRLLEVLPLAGFDLDAAPREPRGSESRELTMSKPGNIYVEPREQGDFAMRREHSKRAKAVLPTQGAAIDRAGTRTRPEAERGAGPEYRGRWDRPVPQDVLARPGARQWARNRGTELRPSSDCVAPPRNHSRTRECR